MQRLIILYHNKPVKRLKMLERVIMAQLIKFFKGPEAIKNPNPIGAESGSCEARGDEIMICLQNRSHYSLGRHYNISSFKCILWKLLSLST